MGFILMIILGIILSFFIFNLNNKLKQEKNENEKLNTIIKEKIQERKGELTQELELLTEIKKATEQDIKEKQQFNDSLLKIREEELDRLIKNKEIQKLELLNYKIQKEEDKFNLYSEQLNKQFLIEKEKIENELNTLRTQRDSINQIILKEKQKEQQQEFYMININKSEQLDIQVLYDIMPKLKHREAISKLVWELYVRRPLQEMIKRVVNDKKGGIYKITYIKTGESYIGKTTNFSERWKNHIRTVLGLDGAAHSSLHTHMEKNGIWNYTFDIVEEVDKDKLSEREKFYIDFYDTVNYGLNQKRG